MCNWLTATSTVVWICTVTLLFGFALKGQDVIGLTYCTFTGRQSRWRPKKQARKIVILLTLTLIYASAHTYSVSFRCSNLRFLLLLSKPPRPRFRQSQQVISSGISKRSEAVHPQTPSINPPYIELYCSAFIIKSIS